MSVQTQAMVETGFVLWEQEVMSSEELKALCVSLVPDHNMLQQLVEHIDSHDTQDVDLYRLFIEE